MVIQRLSDLVWMTQGICKINQAQLKLVCARLEHAFNNCSVMQSVMNKCKKDEVDNFPEDTTNEAFRDMDFEVEEATSPVRSEKETTTAPFGANDQRREYSTACHNNHYHHRTFLLGPRLKNAIKQYNSVLGSPPRSMHFHTTPYHYAITAEDLAKVAELSKSKLKGPEFLKGDKTKKTVNLTQRLSERSKETRVPSSRIGRVASFGGLAAGLMLGTVSEMAKKSFIGTGGQKEGAGSPINMTASSLMNDANMERIVSTLCRVRGAALKLGQMLSIQDDSIIDPRLLEVFDRVRQSADFMPVSQMKKVLEQELGKDWREKLDHFEEKPFAAASIGQVHRGVLHDGREVAMKIQYPGVADSINSDINNLVGLLKFWNLFPEKFFIDKFIAVAQQELALECDYVREAEYSQKFRKILDNDSRYQVPDVIPELCTKRVITTELISGMPLDKVAGLDQDTRNYVAHAMLNLLMREIFEFRMMQTDPNWSNFFYDPEKRKINLLDFGASREFSQHFVDEYIEVVHAASIGDRATVLEKSRSLKFLTGYETKVMEEAHIDAVMIVGEPFAQDEEFDFGTQDTTRRIARLVPTMLEHRLTAPPEESYSLHRKLSGGFLLAAKLKSKFACRHILEGLYEAHHARKSNTK